MAIEKPVEWAWYCGALYALLDEIVGDIERYGLNNEEYHILKKTTTRAKERLVQFKKEAGW